jgi:magnesium-transporting ATPase (P-type)
VTLYCKGAPEVILDKSLISAPERGEILTVQAEMTRRGERVLGLAYRENAPPEGGLAEECDLCFRQIGRHDRSAARGSEESHRALPVRRDA